MPVHDDLEIEVKFHLSETDPVRERILALGGTPSGRVFESNTRFEDKESGLKARGILLRLRQDKSAKLTFKSLPKTTDKDFKIHRELEIEVDDLDTCRAILEGLGFHEEQAYEKWRETFLLDHTELCIDAMPYGVFLEIEGRRSDIRSISKRLGLRWEERILFNYLEIFDLLQGKEALSFNNITFQNFEETPVEIEKYLHLLYAG